MTHQASNLQNILHTWCCRLSEAELTKTICSDWCCHLSEADLTKTHYLFTFALSHTTHHRRACTHVVRRNKLKFKLDL
jgi:hypothetical protein